MASQQSLWPGINDLITSGRFRDHEITGHGVWSLHGLYPSLGIRSRLDGWSENRGVTIVYDATKWSDDSKNPWCVKIEHWFSCCEEVAIGWGNSRKQVSKRKTRYRSTEKRFASKRDAISYAEKIITIIEQVVSASEVHCLDDKV